MSELLYYLSFWSSEMVAGNSNDLPYDVLVCCGLPLVLCG